MSSRGKCLTTVVGKTTSVVVDREGFCDRIQDLRSQTALTADELGELAELSGSGVRFIEIGKRVDPRLNSIRSIARVFRVSLDWLIEGEGDAPTEASLRAAVGQARRRAAQRKRASG